jgi:hypothetical protein
MAVHNSADSSGVGWLEHIQLMLDGIVPGQKRVEISLGVTSMFLWRFLKLLVTARLQEASEIHLFVSLGPGTGSSRTSCASAQRAKFFFVTI